MSLARETLEEQVRKAAKDNPDLPVALIRDILIARQEKAVAEYRFG